MAYSGTSTGGHMILIKLKLDYWNAFLAGCPLCTSTSLYLIQNAERHMFNLPHILPYYIITAIPFTGSL